METVVEIFGSPSRRLCLPALSEGHGQKILFRAFQISRDSKPAIFPNSIDVFVFNIRSLNYK